MSIRASLGFLVARPRSSAVLALLFATLGGIAVSGIVPLSLNRPYFAGHEWVLAFLSWLAAAVCGYCAFKGMKSSPGHG
ncbi:MAG: hypothetical protein WCE48_02230 [Steroidobacteraceae bacterium]|jgi:hypothetical protein